MRRNALLLTCLCLAPCRAMLAMQTTGTVAASGGTVRTSDGELSNALTVSAGLRHVGLASVFDVQALVSALPHGDWNTQLFADAWGRIAGRANGAALALVGSFAGSALPGDALSGSARLLVEGLYQRASYGTAFSGGLVLGAIRNAAPQYALRMRARGWLQSPTERLTMSIEPTYLDSAWYVDASLVGLYERGPFSATLSALGRITESDQRATGGAYAAYRLSDRVSVEGGYGGFLPDPFLGFAAATSGSLGIRIALGSHAPTREGPLVARRHGEEVIVQVRVPGAQQVAIAGEWGDWKPMPLRRVKRNGDVWEGTLEVVPGMYRFNIIIDETKWAVPQGVTSVADGFGGHAGVLIIPSPTR